MFCFCSGKNLGGAQLPLLPPRFRRTLRSAPTKGGEQFAVQTFEPAKWAMTMFRNLIARWHFYVSIEKFQFTFPPLANTRYKHQNKNQQQLPIPPVDLHCFFEISIRTEKKIQLELKKKFSYKLTGIFFQCSLKFFFSSRLRTEKKFQWALKKNFS